MTDITPATDDERAQTPEELRPDSDEDDEDEQESDG
ncbi:hypothetical protein C497_03850 [Halalkalicoccus jeotgali B3]|uniref:Uncharacterized protein n=1 Tax=Halalkalicoccus jeotgali (strain DSM 18796 / CECT 7217 / JCM 14584 / KCTC 4019 / B3) TaxID=795797 RepID=D8J9W4_HALJB|nr:hypothetical protein HacjB3_05475 [Halalkalicoccus jeotgali B3]ELY40200.1 hypothetical protein C497_03850 [Halalkalicoccus jeotgali B3]